jgi:nitrite reductase/ring-hydroxylating ferredoxin subunit
MTCPHCTFVTIRALTKKTHLGYRTFRCAMWQRRFNERTGTPYN